MTMSKAKRKIPREKPWDVYAYKYMEHNDGNIGECDLAIAFRAGVRFVQDRLFISCKKEAPRAEINKQIIMLEYYGGAYDISVIFASEYKEYINTHPYCVAWTTLAALIPRKGDENTNDYNQV